MYPSLRTGLLCASVLCGSATAASAAPLITAAIDDTLTIPVTHEVSPLLAHANDAGVLPDSAALPHIMLVLKRSPEMQAAFDALVHDQLDRTSSLYRQWLAPTDLRRYGPDQADIDTIVSWLQGHGLTVNSIAPSGMSIDFAGKPSAVAAAFHTSLHAVSLPNGESHIANVTDLAIPAALAPVVRGATLANFFPKPNFTKRVAQAGAAAARSAAAISPDEDLNGYELVTPADLAVIYNLNPLFEGTSSIGTRVAGAGVTIAVVEQTLILADDWKNFRVLAGLSRAAGRLRLYTPGGCSNPGYTGDEDEAALDAEWSSAAAPDADIIEASCASTNLTFGVETALQQLVERKTTASLLSISYGGPEQAQSGSFLAGWSNLLEEAAAQGMSVMISSGDSGVSYDRNAIASHGLAVNGLSSNAYNTTLGGTDFYDTAQGTNSLYWRTTNSRYYGSAKSYIPEIPWDDSCASAITMKYFGLRNTQESCNNSNVPSNAGDGGSGGESVIYAKPAWQSAPGVPSDGMRDQPDVSLFAADGFWAHYLPLCMSDPTEGGYPCSFTNGYGGGGTSFAAPIFAGMMALAVQHDGGRVGLVAPRLYTLAATQFSNPATLANCNATLGRHISGACVFNNVTAGNNAEPCYAKSVDCFSTKQATENIGVLRNANAPLADAYPAQRGYSMATGLGSVNVTNLVIAY